MTLNEIYDGILNCFAAIRNCEKERHEECLAKGAIPLSSPQPMRHPDLWESREAYKKEGYWPTCLLFDMRDSCERWARLKTFVSLLKRRRHEPDGS